MSKPNSNFSELIAQTALDHYNKVLPNKCKPQQGQWTVYSAIVATRQNIDSNEIDQAWVISCATGSKCTTMHPALSHFGDKIPLCQGKDSRLCKQNCCMEQIKGFVLHDCHAEVLARRGLMRVLWQEIINHLESNTHMHDQTTLLQANSNENKVVDNVTFSIKKGVKLHLYISDCPCGDASIYRISQKYASNKNYDDSSGISFTGAKIIVSHEDTKKDDNLFQCHVEIEKKEPSCNTFIAREKVQIKSALRLKSGRSNIPDHLRSSSMSCSDKICKWVITGLQGCGLLTRFIPLPIPLQSIVVSRDPRVEGFDGKHQLEALERAIVSRAKDVFNVVGVRENDNIHANFDNLPEIAICDLLFDQGKTVSDKRTRDEYNNKECCNETTVDYTYTTQSSNQKRKLDDKDDRSGKRIKTQKISSCGICLNWQKTSSMTNENEIEQVVGAKGLVQRKKPKCSSDIVKSASRLSRYSFWSQTLKALLLSTTINVEEEQEFHRSYTEMKNKYSPKFVRNLLHFILSEGKTPLQGWVRNSDGDFFPHLN